MSSEDPAPEDLIGLPKDAAGPVFGEPWQAQAFAMTLALHGRGLFTWSEWAKTLARAIHSAQKEGDLDTGETYYHHWLAALEELVTRKGAASAAELRRTQGAWIHAAHRTPHGRPIELGPGDFGEQGDSRSSPSLG
jgi:nitrile hydratase accessory protein